MNDQEQKKKTKKKILGDEKKMQEFEDTNVDSFLKPLKGKFSGEHLPDNKTESPDITGWGKNRRFVVSFRGHPQRSSLGSS